MFACIWNVLMLHRFRCDKKCEIINSFYILLRNGKASLRKTIVKQKMNKIFIVLCLNGRMINVWFPFYPLFLWVTIYFIVCAVKNEDEWSTVLCAKCIIRVACLHCMRICVSVWALKLNGLSCSISWWQIIVEHLAVCNQSNKKGLSTRYSISLN